MRRVNKNIILLCFILATVFLNTNDVLASRNFSTSTKNQLYKNDSLMRDSKDAIEKALKENNYTLFIESLNKINIKESITSDQFAILVNAYNLFKNNKQSEAVKLLQDNKINPILMRFINDRAELTDTQKEIIKQANDLIKQGKISEAKSLLEKAGLKDIPMGIENKINKAEIKANKNDLKEALEKARILKSEGKIDEAKKVLKDAGVPDQLQDKVNMASTTNKDNKSGFFGALKRLFLR